MSGFRTKFTMNRGALDASCAERQWHKLTRYTEHVGRRFADSKSITGNYAEEFQHDDCIFTSDDVTKVQCVFPKEFTIALWLYFKGGVKNADNYNIMACAIDDEKSFTASIPPETNLGAWHFYTISRNKEGFIIFRIDGKTIATSSRSLEGDLNLDTTSSFFIGNFDKGTVGCDFVADDIVIVGDDIWPEDFGDAVPAEYLDLTAFRRYLVIDVKTGAVYGKVEEPKEEASAEKTEEAPKTV